MFQSLLLFVMLQMFLSFWSEFLLWLWFFKKKNSEKDAQMCIYDASWDTHFGFCCDIDEETSHELASKFL